MALDWLLPKDAVQETADSYHISDTTVYGTGGNPNRNERANTLFVTKTDVDGNRTLQTVTPDSADPLVVAGWEVATEIDGWNEKLLASVTKHTVGQSYAAADIILYHSGVFYKTKSAVPVLTDPPNGTYFDVITADSLYTTYLENTSIEWVEQDEIITSRVELKINQAWEVFCDKYLDNRAQAENYTEADFLDSLLEGALSEFEEGMPEQAERIIRGIFTYYLNAA
jgi:hypothetical protein